MAEINITRDTFDQEVLQSDLPVLVDFWAPWCGPCRMLAPTIAQLAQEQEGRVKVAKVNVDDESALAARFGISSIPTIMLFRGGEVSATLIGLQSKADLEALLR